MLALALTQVALTARASGLLQVSSIRCLVRLGHRQPRRRRWCTRRWTVV